MGDSSSSLAAAEIGRPAADGGLGLISFTCAVEAAEVHPAGTVLDSATSKSVTDVKML